jgi:phenylpropionate dioxygenase-like ring-hydroxylating dioxygenase large terminal subunit
VPGSLAAEKAQPGLAKRETWNRWIQVSQKKPIADSFWELFQEASELWFPIEHGSRLHEAPRRVWLAGVALALFRDRHGVPHALVDRCPHRGVALSLGRVLDDGCLECPFHGWRFAGDGACTLVPLNPRAKREHLGVMALPTVECGGLIWVFTGEQAPPDQPAPLVPDSLLRADVRRHVQEVVFEAHWTRVMENMLDVPHLPWVHARTIGRGMLKRPDAQMQISVDPREHGMHVDWTVGETQSGQPWLEWWAPCGMVLSINNPLGHYRQHVFCVPGKPDETRMVIVSTRKYALSLDRLIWPLLLWFERRILFEDKAVVESSRPRIAPPASDERSVATDEATLHFRKWYWQRRRKVELEGTLGL